MPLSLDNKFPPVIDSTMLSAYGGCPRHFQLGYVDNWKPDTQQLSIHLHAGKCFAKGLEAGREAFYAKGHTSEEAEGISLEALEAAWGDYQTSSSDTKTLDRMIGALVYYWQNYPLDSDHARVATLGGKPAVEFSFAIPLPIRHPESGEPLILSGRCDAITEYAKGLYAMDEKTTSSLGQSWARQWAMRGQFVGYAWAMREVGLKPAGTIVRGVSILKTKYETQEAIVSQPEWKIDRWYESISHRIERMVADYRAGYWESAFGEACNSYGACQFQQVCLAPNPDPWLRGYFKQEEWKPLDRH